MSEGIRAPLETLPCVSPRLTSWLTPSANRMPIFRALGFGLLLVVMRVMLPGVLSAAEQTAIAFLGGAEASAEAAASIAASAALISPASLPPLTYPQAPTIRY